MTLDRIYRLVNFISAKVISGNTVTPVNFNDLLPMVSDILLNTELGKLVQDELTPISDELLSTSPLRPFRLKVQLPISAVGLATLPDNYVRWTSFNTVQGDIAGNEREVRKITVVSDHNAVIQQGNVFARARVRNFCFNTGTGFKFVPYDIGYADMWYIRKPVTPYYDYVQNSTTLEPIYLAPGNSIETANTALSLFDVYENEYSNANGDDPIYTDVYYSLPAGNLVNYRSRTIEVEWEDRTHPAIIAQILKKVSINLSDEKVFQLINENSNI